MITFVNNLKIKSKLLILIAMIILFLAILTTASIYNNIEQSKITLSALEGNIRSSYDQTVKSQVQNAVTLLDGVYKKYQSGQLTMAQAKTLGADLIRGLRYGKDCYFWVDTTEGENVVLLGSSIEGTNRYDYRDARGDLTVQKFIRTAVAGKEDCLDYWFPREGQTEPVRKRGYSKLFRPFGWVVGTGNYVDDIDAEIARLQQEQNRATQNEIYLYLSVFFVFTLFSSMTVLLISRSISEPLKKSVGLAAQISDGVMDAEIEDSYKARKDEIGTLVVSLEKMKRSIASLVESLTEKAEALSREKELLRTTLNAVGDGVVSTDKTGRIVLMNPVAEQLTGCTREEARGRQLEEVVKIIPEGGKESDGPVQSFLQKGKISVPEGNLHLISKTGGWIYAEINASPIYEKNGIAAGTVLVFRDVTEPKKKIEQIRYLGYHDQLTGLYNRTCFEQQMTAIDTPENRPVCLIMADVNGLKLTNDAYGHAAGDKLIIHTADILNSVCRSDDFVCRIGGDEFVILLKQTTREQARTLVERIRKKIAEFQEEHAAYLSVSFGYAEKSSSLPEMDVVLRQAEDSMYREKLAESKSTKRMILDKIKDKLFSTMEEDNENYIAISRTCVEIGRKIGMDRRDLKDLETAALLHDIGKVTVDRAVLCKPAALTAEEWLAVKHHPEAGYHILKSLNELSQVAEYVLAHHEQWNGTGYPKGLRGTEIPMAARIIAVVDSYYAMISDRPFRKAYSPQKTWREISDNAGVLYDPDVVRAFQQTDTRKFPTEKNK